MTFISYAQNYEDLILWRAFKHIDHGFYVDVGANDPIEYSVTYAFYKLAWRGINLEPVAEFYERICQERPFDINLNIAAGPVEDERTLYLVPETGLSTFDPEVAREIGASGRTYTERVVTVSPLTKIFEQNVHEPIHFLKIDVEGFELEVLQGLDLNQWRPWIILVEATKPGSSELGEVRWEPLILNANYRFVYFDGINRFYLANEHPELAFAFQSPPNIFDDFLLYREWLHNETIQQQTLQISALESTNQEIQDELTDVQAELTAQRKGLISAYENMDRLSTELGLTHAKNYELITELSAIHAKNYSLIDDLNTIRTQKSALDAELSTIRSSNADLQSRTGQLDAQISALKTELEKVYRSRSYRITAPLRAIFGAARVLRDRLRRGRQGFLQSYVHRIEPFILNRILQIRRIPVLIQFKNFLKNQFPGFWSGFRRTVLPSYSISETSVSEMPPTTPKPGSGPTPLSEREQHYFDLFQREIAAHKAKPGA